jgi:KRAB domain-containing zinc finger protein
MKLNFHMQTHSWDKPCVCNLCGKRLSSLYNLTLHKQLVHQDDDQFSCSYCEQEFTDNGTLNEHIKQNHGVSLAATSISVGANQSARKTLFESEEKSHVCEKCPRSFFSRFDLLRHESSHTGEKSYACEKCDKTFTLKSTLTKHLKRHNDKRRYACPKCGKSFRDLLNMKCHANRICGCSFDISACAKNTCSTCSHVFTSQRDLIQHQRIHTGEKPFICEQCGRAFARKSDLNQHIRRHMDKRRFNNKCGFSFDIGVYATRNHVCKSCARAFMSRCDLIRHERIHTGERPYTCDHCGKAFTVKSSLNKHIRVHTNEKPFPCPKCGKNFKNEASVKKHCKIVCKFSLDTDAGKEKIVLSKSSLENEFAPDEKPYPCLKCGKNFKSLKSVKNHAKKVCKYSLDSIEGKQALILSRSLVEPEKMPALPPPAAAMAMAGPSRSLVEVHHQVALQPPRHCNYCGVQFLDDQSYRLHTCDLIQMGHHQAAHTQVCASNSTQFGVPSYHQNLSTQVMDLLKW